jgi:formamidopyrimidine-DNA glycosylase
VPELPEVETIRQDLKNKIVNKKITNILVTEEARTNLSRNKFVSELKNKIIKDIDRIGKLIIIVLPNKKYLLVHLKMTGQLIYAQGKKIIAGGHPEPGVEELPNKFTRVEIDFRGEGKLFFFWLG